MGYGCRLVGGLQQVRRDRRALGALAVAAALVSALGGVPARATTPGPPAVLFPPAGAYFGARVEAREGESRGEALARLEEQIGRPVAIERVYERWGDPFPTRSDLASAALGHILYVSWRPVTESWATIASGADDAEVAARADAVRAFGQPMYFSFNHEPENDGALGTPAEFVAAYRHVVNVFRARGVTNVAFAWTMMSSSFVDGAAEADSFYPGDAYVDVIGVDGYNWYPGKPGSRWRSFEDVLAPAHAFAVGKGIPMIVAEYGVQEDPDTPGRKAAWIRDALTTTKSWTNVKALLYYDSTQIYPWIVDSSSSALSAFADVAADPWMDPTGTPTPPPTGGDAPAFPSTGVLLGATVVPEPGEVHDQAVARLEG
jgi:hypothetical protein